MDNKELESRLRNLIIFAIAASEKITSRTALSKINKARDEIENELRRVAEWIRRRTVKKKNLRRK